MSAVKAFRIESKNSQSEMISLPLKFRSFRISVMYIHMYFKTHIWSFVNLIFFLNEVSLILGSGNPYLHILPKLERPALKMHVLWCRTGIYGWNLSEKSILDVWRFISNCTSSQFEVYPSELAIFFINDPRCVGPINCKVSGTSA